jgi:hypothetical protein
VSRRELYVLPVFIDRALREAGGVETWRVVIEESSTFGSVTRTNRPTDREVRAERNPDGRCVEVVVAGRASVISDAHANRRALKLAKNLACGSAVTCPGITACIEGAACPLGLKENA